MVTDETVPRPPANCVAEKNTMKEITVVCEEGHDGGLQQVGTDTFYALNTYQLTIQQALLSVYRNSSSQ